MHHDSPDHIADFLCSDLLPIRDPLINRYPANLIVNHSISENSPNCISKGAVQRCWIVSSSCLHLMHRLAITLFLFFRLSVVSVLPCNRAHTKKLIFDGVLLLQIFPTGKFPIYGCWVCANSCSNKRYTDLTLNFSDPFFHSLSSVKSDLHTGPTALLFPTCTVVSFDSDSI